MRVRPFVKKGLFTGFWVVLLLIQGLIPKSEAGVIGKPTASGKALGISEIRLEFDQVQLETRSGRDQFAGPATSERILIKGIYGLNADLDVHLSLGVSDFATASRQFDGSFGPAIGTGLRWTFLKRGNLHLGGGLQTLTLQSDNDRSNNPRARFHEIESFVGGSFSGLEQVTTYFGFLFASGFGRFENGSTFYTEDYIGVFVGGDFQIYEHLYLSSEARMINETSLTISLSYRL